MQPSGPNRPIELHHSPPPQSPQQGTPRAAPKRTRSHTHTSHPNIHRPPSAACPHTTGPPGTDPPITQQHQVGIYKSKVPIRWPGGPSEAATPDPIPNSAVKRLSAHGTASQDAGESVAARPPDGNLPHPPTRSPPTSPSPSAGWSSPVARQAHNLKVTGSNPVPAPKVSIGPLAQLGGFFVSGRRRQDASIAGQSGMASFTGRPASTPSRCCRKLAIPAAPCSRCSESEATNANGPAEAGPFLVGCGARI